MSGLNTALTIGMQALDAAETALNTTSNNISNANTPGYTDEVTELSENALNDTNGQVTGGGVTVDSIQSLRDEVLNLQIQQQTSAQSSATTVSQDMTQAESYFGSTGTDIGTELTSLASALTALSASPTNSADQQGVIDAAQNLAESFNTTANGLSSVQDEADQQVTTTVSQINSLTSQIAQLNGEMAANPNTANNGGTLEDQRDELVSQLSNLAGVTVTQSSTGVDTITTADGSPLVMGGQSFNLTTQTNSTTGFQDVYDSNGNDITSELQGGTLGGAIQVRDQEIPSLMTGLNSLATQVATAVNSAQTSGYDSNGNAGVAMFTVPTQGAASGMSVAITNPSQIAINSSATGSDGDNVQNLSNALTGATAGGQTPANAYAGLVSQVGNVTENATSQASAIGQNLLTLTNQQNSVSGVSIDDETTNLIRYQTAYEAGARIVSTIQQLSTDTLDMGSSQSY